MTDAVRVMLADLARTVDWRLDLLRETAGADGRIRRLAKSVECALWLVPEPARAERGLVCISDPRCVLGE